MNVTCTGARDGECHLWHSEGNPHSCQWLWNSNDQYMNCHLSVYCWQTSSGLLFRLVLVEKSYAGGNDIWKLVRAVRSHSVYAHLKDLFTIEAGVVRSVSSYDLSSGHIWQRLQASHRPPLLPYLAKPGRIWLEAAWPYEIVSRSFSVS